MADNFGILEPGTPSKTLAADDIGGIHYPRHKMVFGADGAQSEVTIGNGYPVGPAQVAAYATLVEKLYSFFTTTHQNLSLSSVSTCRLLHVTNWTDAFLLLSFNGGTNHHCSVPPKTSRSVMTPNTATAVWARYNNAAGLPAPSEGYAWFEVLT